MIITVLLTGCLNNKDTSHLKILDCQNRGVFENLDDNTRNHLSWIMATDKNFPEFCEYISHDKIKAICYLKTAKRFRDDVNCEKIKVKNIQEGCYIYLKEKDFEDPLNNIIQSQLDYKISSEITNILTNFLSGKYNDNDFLERDLEKLNDTIIEKNNHLNIS